MRPMRISTSPLSALLLCDSPIAATGITRVLQSFGFRVSTPATAREARAICHHSRFDLALYDEDSSEALELASNEPKSAPRAVIMLANSDNVRRVAPGRFHFIVQKPFTRDLLAKTVRATFGLIAQERRSSYRHQVSLAASNCRSTFGSENKDLGGVRIVNISRTGMCIEAGEMLAQESGIEVGFTAEAAHGVLQLKGVVVWSHASGRCGIQLSKLDSKMEYRLRAWLTSIVPSVDDFLPAAVRTVAPRQPRRPQIVIEDVELGLCPAS